ncbi:hypothetical protein [Ferruginibacter albus]|uniref:hypothetical protein n=1 Tax=Ferruginibacter albus TaxID=2875540 RepID=UPI001CC7B6DD|nr:hypothetical protein [Ferruginibacter albus]UAY52835.1 hypothetical protein K9M53_03940 [Ferruginibacter albus]
MIFLKILNTNRSATVKHLKEKLSSLKQFSSVNTSTQFRLAPSIIHQRKNKFSYMKQLNNKAVLFAITILIANLFFVQTSFAQITTGVTSVGPGEGFSNTGADGSGIGSVSWSNPGNVISNDNSYATATVTSSSASHYLQATNYGFTIPTEATIKGITVTVGRFGSSSSSGIIDNSIKLIKAGSIVGSSLASTSTWSTSEAVATYGGATNLWGNTLTPADINSSNFGVALSVKTNSSSNRTASVDYMTIAVTYSGTYKSQFISMDAGSSAWCQGETRTVSITVKNNGTLTWTTGWPQINLGVKWNTNNTIWDDYHVRTSANNLAPGATGTFSFTIQASNATGGPTYTTPLSAGTNNLTFDVVDELISWFAGNGGGTGPGNSVFTSSSQTISAPGTTATVGGTQNICGNLTTLSLGGNTPTTGTALWSQTGGPGTTTFSGGSTGSSTATASLSGTYNYTWTITNGGCSSSASVLVNYLTLPAAAATKTDISCFGANNGTIVITGSGGSGTFSSYSVNNGSTYQTGNTFNNLSVGSYKVRVKDTNGCESRSVQ